MELWLSSNETDVELRRLVFSVTRALSYLFMSVKEGDSVS